jgi:hypothetical protein
LGVQTLFNWVDAESLDLRPASGSPLIDMGSNEWVPPDTHDVDEDENREEPLPWDRDANARFVDDEDVEDGGAGSSPIVDIGAYERQSE